VIESKLSHDMMELKNKLENSNSHLLNGTLMK